MINKKKLKYYWCLFRNFWMKYDTSWFNKRLENITYYKGNSALLIEFKDGTLGVLDVGERFNIKNTTLPDDILKAIKEAEKEGYSNIDDK